MYNVKLNVIYIQFTKDAPIPKDVKCEHFNHFTYSLLKNDIKKLTDTKLNYHLK